MNNGRFILIVFAIIVGTMMHIGQAAGPRDPLTFANTGIYGGFDPHIVSRESPFDFVIVPAVLIDGKFQMPAGQTWNDHLLAARANGKRIIANIQPIVKGESGELQSLAELYNVENPPPIERYLEMFDLFFAEVDEDQLYAITISEENVFWNGQMERLEQVYDHLKERYDVPIYQWYSPSQTAATPGLIFPNIKADGWGVDEYFLDKPLIERAMRMYTIMQKPAFQIVWAAPDMPSVPWSERTFWDQIETCRKYNIPVAFFCWHGVDESPSSNTWGWYPNASPRMRQVYEDFCLEVTRLAKSLPPVSPAEWDLMPAGQKQIPLTPDESRENVAVYNDAFAHRRDFKLWLDVSMSGFAHLKWDSSPLQLKPRHAGEVQSTVRYCFASPGSFNRVSVAIDGSTDGGGGVTVALLSMDGKALAESAMANGSAKIELDTADYADQRFVVVVTMTGHAQRPGQVLAEYGAISVETELAPQGK